MVDVMVNYHTHYLKLLPRVTKEEAVIAGAYTGVVFPGTDFGDIHEYCEKLLGRPIFTHEFVLLEDAIKKASKEDFLNITA